MLTTSDLAALARARLKDASALLSKSRYEGAAYVCGYAVEIALKLRIVRTLKWHGFPSTGNEFSGLQSFRTHNLDMLLNLSGWEAKIRKKFLAEWSVVKQWDPESRYIPPGYMTPVESQAMVDSAKQIVRVLL